MLIVSRHALTRFLCFFKSTMATDQNIKSETLAPETDTVYGRYMMDWHVSPRKSLFLQFCIYFFNFLTYILGNLFVVDRIFIGRLRPEDIQYLSLKIENPGCWNCWSFCKFFWHHQWSHFPISFSVLQCIILTNTVSNVRVS